ncbi:MAG: exo-alpha-sialidase [Opitutaceae bacterium]|nr:exo-alpha-sialidase [Opitutaceae bacterium]
MPAPAPIIRHRTLYQQPDYYCAWPSLVRAHNGDLLLAFCRTVEHLYPAGAIVTMRSTDNGDTWSGPVVAYDTPIDDRECGLMVLPDGRIVMHVWSTFWKAESFTALPPEAYPPEYISAWVAQVNSPHYRAAAHRHGGWTIVSHDHGLTWAAPSPGPDSVHGGLALTDGSLLTAAYRNNGGNIGICAATRPEGPWRQIAIVACPTPDTHYFGEPHMVQLPSGRILLMIRYTARQYDDRRDDLHLWESYSDDQGRTWAAPFRTPLLGFPPHLLVLHDGRSLCTYGYRRVPFGERAALSRDGITWAANEVLTLRDDNGNHDLGYPASIELTPGVILSVYYQKPAFNPADIHQHKACIASTLWHVPPN